MNTKRILFWAGFVIILVLIIWGLIVAMNKPLNTVSHGTPAAVSSLDNVVGPVDAPVTIIEYSDYQCPACEYYHDLVEDILASSTVPIRFVYRHFPLNDVLPNGSVQHPNALPASMASEAAGAQGKFWDMYHLLFKNHAEWTELKDPTDVFAGYAMRIGLNVPQFRIDLSSTTLTNKIMDEKKDGIRIGINATPTFFLNGKFASIPSNYEEFKKIIETAAKNSSK